jgi:hypothetical protein
VRKLWLLTLFALPLLEPNTIDAQSASLDDVLQKASVYLQQWVPQLANVVSTEVYEERSASAGRTQSRRLTSDVLLVQYPGGSGWMLFRDVAETDGRPLTHPPDRLLKLFAEPNADAREQATRITMDSLGYHLGGASSSATNPFLGIALMQAAYRVRLRFRLGDTDRSMGPHVRVLRFDEREEAEAPAGGKRAKLPLLLSDAGRVSGSIWLDEETGQILKTDVHMSFGQTSTSATLFTQDARLGILLPQEMRTTWGFVNGQAKYSNYRRFNVQTSDPELRPTPQ